MIVRKVHGRWVHYLRPMGCHCRCRGCGKIVKIPTSNWTGKAYFDCECGALVVRVKNGSRCASRDRDYRCQLPRGHAGAHAASCSYELFEWRGGDS